MELKKLINRISYFRTKSKMSARELSLSIDKSHNYINSLESNNFQISFNTFFEILKVLNVTEEEFFYDKPEDYKTDMDLLKIFKSMKQDEKESLLTFIKTNHKS